MTLALALPPGGEPSPAAAVKAGRPPRGIRPEALAVLDVSWLLLLLLVFLAVGAAWFVRLLQVDMVVVSVSVLAYVLFYVSVTGLVRRVGNPRVTLLGTGVLHGSGVLFLCFLWHLVGGIQNRVFLLAFLLPVVATGVVMRDWRPYAMALFASAAVTTVALAESPELRWYFSLLGVPVTRLSWEAPAWMPGRPIPFRGAEVFADELLVTLGMFAMFQVTAAAFSESSAALVVRLSDRLRTADELRAEMQGLFQAVLHADPSPALIVYRDTGQVVYASQSFLNQFRLFAEACG